MTDRLQTGDAAPDFRLPRDGGGEVALADLTDRVVVLYFYPKDDTSGCTNEARDFSALAAEFEVAGATVLGVSKDPIKAHDKFRDKHALSVPLLSDAESDVCERYGAWIQKSMYGRTYMGIERSTFVIAGGRVVEAWRKVKVPGHAAEVLAAVKRLPQSR